MKGSTWQTWIVGAVLALGVAGCQNYAHALQRGQGYYERNQYEMALAVFRHLEADQSSLSKDEQVRYCYLRGMTDFRLGYRDDARYWLGLSKASQPHAKNALQDDEKARLDATLADLNIDVYGEPPAPEKPEGSCETSTECEGTQICHKGMCTSSPSTDVDEEGLQERLKEEGLSEETTEAGDDASESSPSDP